MNGLEDGFPATERWLPRATQSALPLDASREWLLGFDGSCALCSSLGETVADVASDRISVLSLHDPLATHWRTQALGPTAPWAPTLFRVRGTEVEAWTGPSMVARMARLLGPRRVWRLAEAIADATAQLTPTDEPRIGRREALVGLAGIAAGLVLAGRSMDRVGARSPADCTTPGGYEVNYIKYFVGHDISDRVNCLYCPRIGSGIAAEVTGSVDFGGYTSSGSSVHGNPIWWRTSGPTGCWITDTALR
jgi:hypothetical protein